MGTQKVLRGANCSPEDLFLPESPSNGRKTRVCESILLQTIAPSCLHTYIRRMFSKIKWFYIIFFAVAFDLKKYTFANSPFPARAGGVYGGRQQEKHFCRRGQNDPIHRYQGPPPPHSRPNGADREDLWLLPVHLEPDALLWNRRLADVQEFYAATDIHYIPTPARYKKEAPFLTEVDSQPLCTVHQNLRKAYLNFFRDPSSFQYPKFKRKKDRADSFTVYCRQYRTGPSISLTSGGVRMPKLGCVKAVLHRRPLHWWSLVSASVSKTRSGKYFCSLLFKYSVKEAEPVLPAPERTLGLWASPVHFYLDSLGRAPEPPELAKSREKLRRMQQRLSAILLTCRTLPERKACWHWKKRQTALRTNF